MNKKASQLVSILLHPLLMPFIGVALILTTTHLAMLPAEGKRTIFKIVVLSTILLPLSMLPLFYYNKIINKITMPQRRERLFPLATTILFYYAGYYILARVKAPAFIQYFLLGTVIVLAITLIIHFKWKISTHMVGIGGITGLLSTLGFLYKIDITYWLILCILAAGITGTSRLYLKAHHPSQIYSGFLLGYVSIFSVIVGMTIW
jgi:membrane-associated phospholipid phosphatase